MQTNQKSKHTHEKRSTHCPTMLHKRFYCCFCYYDTIRYDTRCYFNVCSKADISQLNLPHGTFHSFKWLHTLTTSCFSKLHRVIYILYGRYDECLLIQSPEKPRGRYARSNMSSKENGSSSSELLAPAQTDRVNFSRLLFRKIGLQCFDAVRWAAGRVSGL